jgi:hypothetical protein
MTKTLPPPTTEEYAPFYAEYIQRAQARDVPSLLPQQIEDIKSALGRLSDDQAHFRFGLQEWSIKEVIGHINDGERVFSYRLLRISRNDPTPLSGFEQENYVREAGFDNYPLSDLIEEFEFLRRANILAIKNMPEKSILYRGTASGAAVSVRALIYMMAGHVEHHMESLHKKYLSDHGDPFLPIP